MKIKNNDDRIHNLGHANNIVAPGQIIEIDDKEFHGDEYKKDGLKHHPLIEQLLFSGKLMDEKAMFNELQSKKMALEAGKEEEKPEEKKGFLGGLFSGKKEELEESPAKAEDN